jgi:serine/threonine protein phosphatase PrpC
LSTRNSNRATSLVLCTDGLHSVLNSADIAAAVDQDAKRTAQGLVALARERGGQDNISVVLGLWRG